MKQKEREILSEKEEPQIICELGADPGALIDKALRSFILQVCEGPGISVPTGALLRLTEATRRELFFTNRIEPTYLKDGDIYRVKRPFKHVTPDGLWQTLAPGTRVRLNIAEALDMLRAHKVAIDDTHEEN